MAHAVSSSTALPPMPIAIVGMSGLFPDAGNVDAFWANLRDGRDSVGDVPSDRGWHIDDYYDPKPQTRGKSYVRKGGFLKDIDRFDPLFFEIAPNSAIIMDPTARLFLQEAWRAIEDAGYAASSLGGTRCGMYFCAKGDYASVVQRFEETFLASTDTYAPARLAYHLNLVGPAVSIDTACSSTLSAIAYACDALTLGNCDLAVVGGGGLNSTPNALVTSSQLLLFSPSGRCFTFDARADGTVLGEAVGALVLKPLARAVADHDHIYGLIRGWGMNQDGRTNGHTAPSAKSQVRLESGIYERFAIDPETITMVEAHGTGTKLGDPIEVQALIESFRRFTKAKGFCALGSIKTNIGHTFFGSGVSAVIKVLQSLRHRQIPPSLNFETINPAIKIADSPFYVNTALRPWEAKPGAPRCAAVSAFGATGTNAHVVIEEYEPGRYVPDTSASAPTPGTSTIVLSAKSSDRLAAQARNLLSHLSGPDADAPSWLGDATFTLQTGREAMSERVAFAARDRGDLVRKLEAFLDSGGNAGLPEQGIHRGRTAGSALARMEMAAALLEETGDALNARDADALARLWVQGSNVEWSRLYENEPHHPRRLALPTYPFAGERYWVSQELADGYGKKPAKLQAAALHPLLHTNISNLNEFCFQSTFTGEEFFLRDHQILGRKLLPGVAYLELARAAIARARFGRDDGRPIRFENVVWMQSFVFAPGGETLRIALAPSGETGERTEFEIYSGDGEEVVRYCQGEAHFDLAPEPPALDIAGLRRQCSGFELPASKLYALLAQSGFALGPGHQGVQSLFAAKGQALGQLALPVSVPGGFHLHPSLMDSALQTSTGLLFGTEQGKRAMSVPLPFALEALNVYSACTERMWAWVRYADDHAEERKVIRINIDLCDEAGKVCVQFKGLSSRDAKPAAAPQNSSTVLLRQSWNDAEMPAPAEVRGERHVIYCAAAQELGTADLVEAGLSSGKVTPVASDAEGERAATYHQAAMRVFDAVKESLHGLGERSGRHDPLLIQLVVHPTALAMHVDGLGAILKSACQENPQLVAQTIVFAEDPGPHRIAQLVEQEARHWQAVDVRYAGGRRQVRGQEEIAGARAALPWRNGGVYLVTGGAGGLGRIFAREIAAKCPKATLILAGRGRLDAEREKFLSVLRSEGCEAEYDRVDFARKAEVDALIATIRRRHGALHGVLHCAGALADGYMLKKSADAIASTLAPKVDGLVHLDEATADCPLDFFVAFSSLAGCWGNAGQSDYAAANAFMDAYIARPPVARNGRRICINWPLWREGGMRIDRVYEEAMFNASGMMPLPTQDGLECFYRALASSELQVLVVHADLAKWRESIERRKRTGARRDGEKRAASAGESAGALHARVATLLCTLVGDLIHVDPGQIDPRAELSEFGLDSISLTRLSNTLHDDYRISLSPTVFFEYSTIDDFARLLADAYADEIAPRLGETAGSVPARADRPSPAKDAKDKDNRDGLSRPRLRGAYRFAAARAPAVVTSRTDPRTEPVAIIGMSAQFPMAGDHRQFWRNLAEGRDCITEIPPDRWDWRAIYGDPHEKAEVTDIKWGGFIDGIGDWDAPFFSISPREAELIDPQKRLLMMHVWKAIEDAGYAPSSLWGSNTALYVGSADSGYAALYAQAGLKNDGSGTPTSMGPNRMSYFLNLHGPSEPVETACSSSLVAVNRGVAALREGLCDLAVVGGIQLIPTPAKHIAFSQAGILCKDGRCKTFSKDANGYVRSEGAGMVVLKRLRDAERDSDAIYAKIIATAENHGGRANSLTSPNPRAQAELLKRAYRSAGVDPRSITYIETHGTGTNLGDPIEVNALKLAFRALYEETEASKTVDRAPGEAHCGIGSVKSNIGHAELAAGIAGVIKVLLQMREGTLAESLHCSEVNPHIDLAGSPFEIVRQKRPWRRPTDRQGREVPRRAGVSSFGVGGVNAHVVLEEYA